MSQPPSRSPSQQAADEERRASFLPPWLSRAVSLGAAGAISAIVVASIRDVGPTIGLSWEGAAWLANNFVTESGLRMLLGSVVTRSTASSTSDGAGLSWQETSTFQPVPTGRRAVLSVVVWVPLFSGAVLATVKCLFQLNSRDTVASVRRSSAARASATPPTSYTTARFPAEAKSSPLQDASPFGVESPPLAAAPPERRLDLMEESSSCNTTATATPRDSRSRHPSLPSIPQLGLPADDSSDTAAVDSRTASPTSASTRELDSVTLAIVSPCSLVDLNAFLTAGGKYYVRNVVVPHGNAKRNGAQPSDTAQGHEASENTLRSSQARLIGTTPRGETSPPLPQRFAHVTRRTLEFIGRFQRNVNLCEVSENIDVATFLRANATELHGPRHGAPVVVTVAIHRHPVPNAVRLIDFTHPPSAAYCFAKSPSASLASSSSPVASRTSSFGSPTAARTVDSSFTGAASDEFGSPLTASAYARHVAAAGSRVSDAMEERRPEDEALDFCDLHVYLSGSTAHNTLASTVNMVLYDRAAKRRRMKYTEGDDNHDMATS